MLGDTDGRDGEYGFADDRELEVIDPPPEQRRVRWIGRRHGRESDVVDLDDYRVVSEEPDDGDTPEPPDPSPPAQRAELGWVA